MSKRGKGGSIYVVGLMILAPCGDFTIIEVGATSKLCILGIQTSQIIHTSIHMFGPLASDGGCPMALTQVVIGDASICWPAWSFSLRRGLIFCLSHDIDHDVRLHIYIIVHLYT